MLGSHFKMFNKQNIISARKVFYNLDSVSSVYCLAAFKHAKTSLHLVYDLQTWCSHAQAQLNENSLMKWRAIVGTLDSITTVLSHSIVDIY